MNDAEYIKALAHQYAFSNIPELVQHRERLLAIAARLEPEETYEQRKMAEAKTWKRGDRLRVIRREPNDRLQIGDIVYHCDRDGSVCPYVSRWPDNHPSADHVAMDCTELEKL